MMKMSPPPTTEGGEDPIEGNGKTLKPDWGFNEVFTTPGTKSPSITIAAFGLFENTLETEVGKSVCSAPEVPPAMFLEVPTTVAISPSAFVTDGSVHLI